MIISESVSIHGEPASNRNAFVIDANTMQRLWSGVTDDKGEIKAEIPDKTDSVIAIVIDNVGVKFNAQYKYSVGDIVEPEPFIGFKFECYVSGVAGEAITNYPLRDGAIVSAGTVSFIVRQHFQPVAKFIPL